MGIAEMGFYFLLEIWASFFQAYQILRFSDFDIFFFNSDFNFIKNRKKKCVYVIMLKIALLLVKNVSFGLKNGISELVSQIAAKPTAIQFIIFK